ncbi:hypothetical protein DRQ25_01505 [Candidatus Fermentibacteria bacterium]|nr:MAG: hypothetical protein DRQ25_01505 [Candidatus Fermentibacteria bacterium]
MIFLIRFILSVILTEALTELISKSEIMSPIRKWFFDHRQVSMFNWIHNLLDCGYCTSVWIGLFTALTFLFFSNIYLDLFFAGIIIHRLSNVLHFLIDRTNSYHE